MTPGGAYRVGVVWPRKPANLLLGPLILILCLSTCGLASRPPRFAGRARCGRVCLRGTKGVVAQPRGLFASHFAGRNNRSFSQAIRCSVPAAEALCEGIGDQGFAFASLLIDDDWVPGQPKPTPSPSRAQASPAAATPRPTIKPTAKPTAPTPAPTNEFPTRGVRIVRGRHQDQNDFQCVTDPSVTEHDGKKIAFACCEADTCSRKDADGQCLAGDLRSLSNFAPKDWHEATNVCAAEGKVLCGVDKPCSRGGCMYDNHYQWTGEACQAGDTLHGATFDGCR